MLNPFKLFQKKKSFVSEYDVGLAQSSLSELWLVFWTILCVACITTSAAIYLNFVAWLIFPSVVCWVLLSNIYKRIRKNEAVINTFADQRRQKELEIAAKYEE